MENNNYRFRGKVVFVTGGSSGIGMAIADRFLTEGAFVMVASRSIGKLKTSDKFGFIKTDVASEDQVKNALEATKRKFGKIDIVVNNAGILGL